MSLGLNILLIFILLVIGSMFSGTESASVSLHSSQIEQMEQEDAHGAKVAKIACDPNTLLSTVQIGVMLCGFLSVSFGTSSISPYLIPVVEGWGVPTGIAGGLANIVLTLTISYCSIVISEMVPKRIAMQRTEQIVRVVAPTIDVLATICRSIIWLIGKNTNGIVRMLGFDPQQTESEVPDDELHVLVSSNTNLSRDECIIPDDVFDASETIVAEVTRPRADVVSVEAGQPLVETAAFVRNQPYPCYPVTDKDFDDVIGFVCVCDLLDVRDPRVKTVRDVVCESISLPGTSKLLPSLELLRKRGTHLAMVINEYGDTDGIVTLEGMTEEFVGDIRDEYDPPSKKGGECTTRTALVSGVATIEASMTIEDFADLTGIGLEGGPYEMVAGYFPPKIGKMGAMGDVLHSDDGYNMVITKVDGRRIETVKVRRTGAPDHASLPAKSQSDDANQSRDIHHPFVWPGA